MNTKERKVFNSRPLFYGFLALLIAIASARHIFAGKLDWILIVSFILIAFLVYCLWSKKYIILAVILSVFAFGIGWFFVGLNSFEGNIYTNVCQIEGRVGDDVYQSSYGNSLYVTLEDVEINGKDDKNISLTIYVDDAEQIKAGDILSFEAKVNNQQLYELGSFNLTAYRDGTAYICQVDVDDVSVVGNHLTPDEKFRIKAKSVLYQQMGERNGAVAYAVLFGDKSEIDADIKTAYQETGIIHLLTVSGLHMSFLILLIGFILKKCRVRGVWNFLICLVFLLVYAWLCGFSPSVVRASVMGLVLLGARLTGKCYDGLNSLGLVGIILLLCRPLFAVDVGFLMSFFCVISIYVVSPYIIKILKKIFPKKIAEAIGISVAIQLGVLPFFGEIFSTLNFLSFFINLIVIPFFGILFPALFVSMFVVMAMPFMGFALKVCGWGFDLIFKIADFFAQTKLKITLEPMNIVLIVLMFLFLFLLSKFFMAKKKIKAICCSCVLTLFVAVEFVFAFASPSASVAVAYNYSSQVVMLTNSKGNTLSVGAGSFAFNRRLMNSNYVNDVDVLLMMNDDSVSSENLSALKVDDIFCLEEHQTIEGQKIVQRNEVVLSDGFAFIYKFYNSEFVGLEILFDETSVFVLNQERYSLSAQAVESVAQNDYDIVVLGKYDKFAETFFNNCGKLLTYYANDYSTASYQSDGNVVYAINGDKIKRGIID